MSSYIEDKLKERDMAAEKVYFAKQDEEALKRLAKKVELETIEQKESEADKLLKKHELQKAHLFGGLFWWTTHEEEKKQ